MRNISQKIQMNLVLIVAVLAVVGSVLVPSIAYAANSGVHLVGLPIISQIISFKNLIGANQVQAAEVDQILPQSNERTPDKVVSTVFTAYTSTVDQTDDDPFIAASGKRVYDGMVAANWLPMGTKVKIPSLYGDKIFTVDDRMNARYGYGRMDIWLDTTKAEARKFGVKRADIEVYFDFNKNR
ncbi:MAG: hypothetical protein Q7S66_00340 [bacterium]|nr:hypothetical protein [bacterium]